MAHASAFGKEVVDLEDFWMRDPFVVVLPNRDGYVLFGTTDEPPPDVNPYAAYPGRGFAALVSPGRLASWRGPAEVFRGGPEFWGNTQFWAPEVFCYRDTWYLVASFGRVEAGEVVRRGVQLCASASGRCWGPYEPRGLLTPPLASCLDGHVYVEKVAKNESSDSEGADESREECAPYLIFCHEWTQIRDGAVCLRPLSAETLAPAGEPEVLWRASEAPWVRDVETAGPDLTKGFVTDGPFVWESPETGELLLLWSSLGEEGRYCVGCARSRTGIRGPWSQDPEPVYDRDGGHPSLFRPNPGEEIVCFNGKWDGAGAPPLIMTIHAPNARPEESRARFFLMRETVRDGRLLLSLM